VHSVGFSLTITNLIISFSLKRNLPKIPTQLQTKLDVEAHTTEGQLQK
jgi:hypothetical protein